MMNANENMGMTEEQALNQQLQSMNGTLSGIFARLGQAYYDLKSENPDEELASFINEAKDLYEQQKKIDIRLKFLRGIVVCTECGQENGVASSFCNNCGTTLPHKLAQMDGTHCTKCGAVIVPGTKFCGVCGGKIENPIPAETPAAAPAAEEAVDSAVEAPVAAPVEEAAPVAETVTTPAEAVAPTADAVVEALVSEEAPAQFAMQEDVNNVNGPVYNNGFEPQPVPVDEKRFCANCGAQILEADAMFCAECGARI